MKLLYVYNPIAGGKDKKLLHQLFSDIAQNDNHEIIDYKTTGKNDESTLSHKIKQYKPDRVIAAGGDGTIQLTGHALYHTNQNIPMGIIPMGSANGLATCLQLSKDLNENIITSIRSSTIKSIDILRINEQYICLHLFDIGINALLIKEFDQDNRRGMLGYGRHLIDAINNSPMVEYTITNQETTVSKPGYMLIGANGNQYGTGVVISEGSMRDGYFDLRIISEVSLKEAIKSGLTILNIFIDDDMFPDTIRCKRASIYITPKAPLQIDGEYIGEVSHVEAVVIPSAIKVIIPDE